jgi:hypothetical protein
MVMGLVVDFVALIIWRGGVVLLLGVFEKEGVFCVVFCGDFVVDCW